MHSLFVRIFVLFWVAMALIVAASIATTFAIASREYAAPEAQHRAPSAVQASAVLARGGVGALKAWLAANRGSFGDRDLFIIDPDGRDILGRRIPESVARRLDYSNRETPNALPGNFRPPRAAPQIVAADGGTYTVVFALHRPSIFGALSLPAISLSILLIALIVSALTTWWLADHLTAPIRRIQAGARALAAENLDARVSAGLEERKDELAVLARDFDAMAEQLRAHRAAATQLLRDISHELRSPLARMRVALGLARRPAADLPRQLDRLEREVERLDGMIGQVLKLARLQGTGAPFGAPVARESFALDEIIEEVVRDANFEGAGKHCQVKVQGMVRTAVLGNRELLRSAIENVLRNAVRYSPHQAAVELRVARANNGLEIAVRDHGPGVPAADLERIFEPFYRVAESRDRDSGGEGIGLAITSQVMKAHGGSAKASNQPQGFEVRLSLPETALAL